MLKRIIIPIFLLFAIIGLAYTVPGGTANANTGTSMTCDAPYYVYERIDGVCYRVTYCEDGTFLNEIPASDSMCP